MLEVGCGTGLWSCVAARLGAREVWAVEPTAIGDLARELFEANGLADRVRLLPSTIEEAEPRPVDLAFSELLNADPFYEGVVEATEAAAAWVVPGGILAPRRLRVWTQLVRGNDSAHEAAHALDAVRSVGARFELEVGPLLAGLSSPGPYRYLTSRERLASEPVLLWDLALGTGLEPEETVRRVVQCSDPGPVAGALVWFEAELEDGLVMSNPPGTSTHWGQFVSAWSTELALGLGGQVTLVATLEDDSVTVAPELP